MTLIVMTAFSLQSAIAFGSPNDYIDDWATRQFQLIPTT
jgi:hypothetical protein